MQRLLLITVLAFLAAFWSAEWNLFASATAPTSAVLSERNYGEWGYTVARSATDRIEVRFALNGVAGLAYQEQLTRLGRFVGDVLQPAQQAGYRLAGSDGPGPQVDPGLAVDEGQVLLGGQEGA